MIVILLVLGLIVAGAIVLDGGGGAMDEYCRMECWDSKVERTRFCCREY